MGMKPRLNDGPASIGGSTLCNQPKKVDEFSNEGGGNLVTSLKTGTSFSAPNLSSSTKG